MRYRLLTMLVVALCAGCTSMGRLSNSIPAPSSSESIFVLGVAPEKYRVMIFPGTVEGGVFVQNGWAPATFYGSADQGFVVGKTKAGSQLAITIVRVTENEKDILGDDFIPCGPAKTLVFDAAPGKVTYLGSVLYRVAGPQLEVEYWNDLDAARSYTSRAYPALGTLVEQGSYRLLPTSTACNAGGGTIYVPVYLPR